MIAMVLALTRSPKLSSCGTLGAGLTLRCRATDCWLKRTAAHSAAANRQHNVASRKISLPSRFMACSRIGQANAAHRCATRTREIQRRPIFGSFQPARCPTAQADGFSSRLIAMRVAELELIRAQLRE